MILPVIRELAAAHSLEVLKNAAERFEKDQENLLGSRGKDEGEILSNLLMAIEVRKKMDSGMDINDAIKDHTRMIRGLVRAAGQAKPKSLGLFGEDE